MAKNGFRGGMGGMGNMQAALARAQKMQEEMQKAQEELSAAEFEASAGGGMVTVRVTGEKRVVSVAIKPEAVDPDDVEMLQDLITAGVNAAMEKAEEAGRERMAKVTGGMNIPGLF